MPKIPLDYLVSLMEKHTQYVCRCRNVGRKYRRGEAEGTPLDPSTLLDPETHLRLTFGTSKVLHAGIRRALHLGNVNH